MPLPDAEQLHWRTPNTRHLILVAVPPIFEYHHHLCRMRKSDEKSYKSTLHLPKHRRTTSYLQATCAGQSANPGPPQGPHDAISWIHVNPTAIHGKAQMLQQLGAQIICCSETSATAQVQGITTKEFRSLGFTSVWSVPAAPHRHTDNPSPEIRGKATGLSLHSVLPIRRADGLHPTLYHAASRLLRSFVSLGSMTIQVVQVYGYPKPAFDAREATEQLAQAACREAFELNMPTVIVGDLNHHPTTLPALKVLLENGYRTSEQLYIELHQEPQPPTCRGVTKNDVFLFSPHIVPWIADVFVKSNAEFADHAPIGITMKVPREVLYKTIYRRPQTWIERTPEPARVHDVYSQLQANGIVETFEQWAQRCEKAVHDAIQRQHQDEPETYPYQGLNRAQRGRCKAPRLIKVPIAQPIKPAGPSQYNPALSQASSAFRQCLRQLRRIQSLYHRLRKLHAAFELRPDWHQLTTEWQAIRQAKVLEMPFETWILQHPEFTEVPQFLPSIEMLFDVQQLFAHRVRQFEAAERKRQQDAQVYQRLYDRRWGSHKQAYRAIRKPSNPCLQEIWQKTKYEVTIVDGHGTGLLECTTLQQIAIPPRAKLTLQDSEVRLCNQSEKILDLMVIDADKEFPSNCILEVSEHSMEPTNIGRALHHYWSRYWGRDSTEEDWSTFEELMESTPSLQPMATKDPVQMWTWAIRHLKKNTAKGICGWTAEELQLLPQPALTELVTMIETRYPGGFPADMMLARTLPIGKVPTPELPEQTRPITVLSLLYRTWGKVCCTQVLRHWAQQMPREIVGFIPTRNMNLQMLRTQHSLELSQAEQHDPTGGLTLDLTKAFNLLPRVPSAKALIHTGVTADWVQQWLGSQSNMRRTWEIASQAMPPSDVTTGAPEGDTWSVCCMLSLSYIWISLLKQRCSPHMAPSAYADNLGWMSTAENDYQIALDVTEAWASSLKLQVDWQKTWTWANGAMHAQAWTTISQTREVALHRLTNARELGYMLAYNKRHNKMTFKQRKNEAIAQLAKIARLPHDLQTKALLTKGPISKAVFASEITAVGQQHIAALRTALTRALLGPQSQANPYVAMVCLSKFVQDPLVTFVLHSLRQVRHFLFQATSEEVQTFFSHAAAHTGEPLQVRGPAGALKYNLNLLQLGLNSRGHILVDGFVTLPICEAPWEMIHAVVTQAWLERLPGELATRKEWRHLPVINEQATKRLLAKYSPKAQKILAFEITGAYQTARQKIKWTQMEKPLCVHCNEEDSVIHRRLFCPALQSVRDEHAPTVAELHAMDDILVTLPVIYQHPLHALDRCLAWQAPRMRPDESILQDIYQQINRGLRPLIFTDGSAAPADEPLQRRAAFAVIYLPHQDESKMRDLVTRFETTGEVAHEFQTLGVARTRGLQTIPRSELQAAVEVVTILSMAEIVTDSQYVIDSVSRIETGTPTNQLRMMPNGDLLVEMQTALQKPDADYVWTKVRSHHAGQTQQQKLHAAGNEAADYAAKQTRKDLADTIHHVPDADIPERRALQARQYDMMVDLNYQRAKLEKGNQQGDQKHLDLDHEQTLHVEVDNPHLFPLTNREESIQWSTWGAGLAQALHTWLKGLRWPSSAFTEQAMNEQDSPGVSWLELLLDFQQAIQIIFPMNFAPRPQAPKLRTPTPHRDCHQADMHMTGMIRSFQAAIKQLEKILNQVLMPERRKVVRTLYMLGSGHQPIGLAARPVLWKPIQVQQTLTQHYAMNPRTWTFEEPLTFTTEEPTIRVHWTEAEKDPSAHDEHLRTRELQQHLGDLQR